MMVMEVLLGQRQSFGGLMRTLRPQQLQRRVRPITARAASGFGKPASTIPKDLQTPKGIPTGVCMRSKF
jgi:hypothetical protein